MDETKSQVIDTSVLEALYKRISLLEGRINYLESRQTVYGPIEKPATFDPAPYWQNPDWVPPKIT